MPASSSDEPRRPTDTARLALARLKSGPNASLDAVFRDICRIASETLSVARVGIWFFTAHHHSLRCACLYEAGTGEYSAGATLQVADFPSYFAALECRRSIPAEVARNDPRTSQLTENYLRPLGITSLLDATILRDGEVIGTVCHEHIGSTREWTTEERDFSSAVADCVTLQLKAADLNDARAVLHQSDEFLFALERSESMERIAVEAAHDFKNILTVVIGFATELTAAPDMPHYLREMASHILKAGERGSELVRLMTAYGQSDADAPAALVPGEVVERILPLLRTAAGSHWKFQLDLQSDPGRIFLDPSQLERVVYNLAMNARDAMPDGGTIRIEYATADGVDPAGRYACLSVRDSGAGMDDRTLARIFEPFFTTKPRGHGTGLGMAIVLRIVERAGGFIRIESEPGRGTTVRVYFPFVTRG